MPSPGAEGLARLARFGVVGVVNTLAGFAVVAVLDPLLGLQPALANAVGYLVGAALGFFLNRLFVFRAPGAWRAHALRYGIAVGAAFLLNQIVLRAAGLQLGPGRLERLIAEGLAMASYSASLFLLCRGFVFAPAAIASSEPAPDAGEAGGEPPEAALALWRRSLNEETGGGYFKRLKALSPRYRQVWRDIALGYLGLVLVLFGAARRLPAVFTVPQLLLAATAVGYGLAYLQLFIHEAAHGNLCRNRRLNDALADTLLSWHLGADAAAYRSTHLDHHKHHGGTADSERTYFQALTLRFVLEGLTGLQALRVFRLRAAKGREGLERDLKPLLRGLAAHGLLLGGLLLLGGWRPALAWSLGVGVFLPFFSGLRQVLEHRSPSADASADYASRPHGPYTRIFRGGLLTMSFGGAGFDRHLLHHLEPQVSYTRLPELEAFLRTTSADAFLETRTTTYAKAFKALWRSGRRPHALA